MIISVTEKKASAVNRAIRSLPGTGTILLGAGRFLMDETINLNFPNIRLVGDGIMSTLFQPAPGVILQSWIEVTGTDCEIERIRFLPEDEVACVRVMSAYRAHISRNFFIGAKNVGTAIKLVNDSHHGGAYNHYIWANEIGYGPYQGIGDLTAGISIDGVITSTMVKENHFTCTNPIKFESEIRGGGGNVFWGNIFQSWRGTSASFVGVGIAFKNQSGAIISANYFERFDRGIQIDRGSSGIEQSQNHWDKINTRVFQEI